MKLLSRLEEFLLLAVWRLQGEGYAVTIRDHLQRVTGKKWSFGSLFVSLDRLVKKGYLTSSLTEPTPERGGRSKRIYQLTPVGLQALAEAKSVEQAMWEGLTERLPALAS